MMAFPSAFVANVTHTIAGRTVITLQPHLSPEQRDEALELIATQYDPRGYGWILNGATLTIHGCE